MTEEVNFTFQLPDSFIEPFKTKKPPFGFPDAAGNSVGELVFARTYSRKKSDSTKEQWWEVCKRITEGTFTIQKNYCLENRMPWSGPKALATAKDFYERLFDLKWSPPGRGLFSQGTINTINRRTSNSLQNCAVISTHDMPKHNPAKCYIWLMEASMNGIGVGFDTRGEELGIEVRSPNSYEEETYVIPDTREGWAESVGMVINAFLADKPLPKFDYSEIRPYGAPIKTFGGTASGPKPLIDLHQKLGEVFKSRLGDTVDSRLIVDICNLIGVAVVSGNVRRSAELAMGRIDDTDFINLKNPAEFPDRQSHAFMSNNSVNASVGSDLSHTVEGIKRGGEPGVIWMDMARKYGRLKDPADNKDYRVAAFNPCLTGDSLLLNEKGYVSFFDAYKNGESQNILVDSRITYSPSEDGEEHPDNWSISYEPGARAVTEKASEVFLTQRNAEVVKVSTFEGYDVRLTPEHLVATRGGMVAAGELHVNDEILLTAGSLPRWTIQNRDPETIKEMEAALMGLLAGDGTYTVHGEAHPNKTPIANIDLWNDDREHVNLICQWIDTLFNHYKGVITSNSNRKLVAYNVSHQIDKNKIRINSTFLTKLLDSKYGFNRDTKHEVPKLIMEQARSTSAAFYVAAFAFADGTVNKYSKVGSSCIRLNQSNKAMLQQIQLILLANGMDSKIYSRRPEGEYLMPDGKGGMKEYHTLENFDLILSTNKYEYTKHIGFLGSHKDRLAQELFTKPSQKRPTFKARVVSVLPDGNEDVYCLREPKRRILAANGISMRRCAEQPLEPYECCTLCDVYLHNAESLEDFKKTLKVAFLYGKTVTLVATDWPETNQVMQRNRRIGTSLSGVADFVDNHGLPKLRGWLDEGFDEIKRLDRIYSEWLCVRESIRTTTIKPGGTTGVVAGTSPGAHWTPGGKFFLRRVTFDKNDPIVESLRHAGYKIEESFYTPETSVVVEFPIKSKAKRSEAEVSIYEKISLAADLQHWWSDNAVSVTVSFDPEKEADDIERVLHMYEGKLKTVSFLPMGGAYEQMPYEPITEDEYEERRVQILPIDMAPIYGLESKDAIGESFCNTDACLIEKPEDNSK